jgi:amino acid adenylation domain-containing protein
MIACDDAKYKLSPAKRAMLAERLQNARRPRSSGVTTGRSGDAGEAPLSFAQERFWILQQFDPGSVVNNRACNFRLTGQLDVVAMGRAVVEVVRRHEVLRTCFPSDSGRPVPRILPPPEAPPAVVDLRGVPAVAREAMARRLAADERERRFDLEGDRPVRAVLLRLEETDHVLLWTVHHIAFDGWSAEVLRYELAALYGAFVRGEPSPLSEPPLQYAEYALRQRERLRGEMLERPIAFWRKQMAEAPPVLNLLTDRPGPAERTERGGRLTAMLDAPLVRALKDLGRGEGATLFMTLLAAFQALLGRIAGTSDIAVACPVAGRNDPALEDLIGPFINTLPFRTKLEESTSFRTLLSRTRTHVLEALAHSDVPFEKLVEELKLERLAGNGPFFQVFFQLRNFPEREVEFPGLSASPFVVDPGLTPFELALELWETRAGLACSLDYSLDLFERQTASRLVDRYRALLKAVVADPDQPIEDVPLFTDLERDQVLRGWNATALDLPFETCLHRLFEDQCARTPEAVAVVLPDVDGGGSTLPGELSYAELNRRANRLAHHLRACGARPDVPVAVVAERSLEMVVGLLGVLKSGAAYLPIDPATPVAWRKVIFDDARPLAVVTQPHLAYALAGLGPDVAVVALAGPAEDPPGPESNPDSANAPGDLAYVIYTSGSTGLPKGVMNEHRAVCNMILWMQHAFPIGPADRVVQKTPYTFDLSVWEFFWPLMAGARIVLAQPGGQRDPSYLARLFKQARVSICSFVPSALGPFLDDPGAPSCRKSLRRVFSIGEPLTTSLRDQFFRRLGPAVELHNLYGPTEAAVEVTHHHCIPDAGPQPIPIGRPIANTRVYVLDERGRPRPIGVPGELYLGGVCVARGYLNRPDLTAERFASDPFADEAGQTGGMAARIYRTGDRGRWRPDGSIEFMGRLDDQVKVRGVRVEPGEVAAVLARHPGVADAAVIAIEQPSGGALLTAYVVPRGRGIPPLTEAVLRSFVATELPETSIPSKFVTLDAIPLTNAGKVDRGALRALVSTPVASPMSARVPSDETEAALVELWREFFPGRSIGVQDDFFALGGRSLVAVRLLARVKERFGYAPPLTALLRAPTIERLAAAIRDRPRAVAMSPLIALNTEGNVEAEAPALVCFPGSGGTLLGPGLALAGLARLMGPAFPFYAVSFGDPPPGLDLAELLPAIAERFLVDLRAVLTRGPYHLGGYSRGGLIALEVARRLIADGETVALLALLDVHGPNYPRRREWPEWLSAHAANLRRLSTIEKLRYGAGKLREKLCQTTPHRSSAVDPSVALMGSQKNYLRSLKHYPGRITLFRAAIQPDGARFSFDDPTNGWGAIALGGVGVISVPGDHLTMLEPPNLPHLANVLRACLRGLGVKHDD